jgi:predicted transcriptional regulator of viral defense system
MKQTILSNNQSEILENLIVKHGQLVTSSQIYEEAKRFFDYQESRDLIQKLLENGWLIRIKRELYAISDLSSRGYLSLSPFVVANLIEPDSYVSFESALQYKGLFDQLTNRTVSVALNQQKTFSISGMKYSYIKTKLQFFFGWLEVNLDNRTTRIAISEKALIDLIHFHRSEYSIDLVIEKLTNYKMDLDIKRFNEYLANMPRTTQKIFGFLFDLVGINSNEIYERVSMSRSPNWMFPGDKKFNAKWRLYYRDYFDKYTSL